jgi:hypothetical protein
MGHIHLGVLPNSKKWRDVVELLNGGASDGDVVSASALAVEKDLAQAAHDPLFVETVRLLAMIPQAAAQDNFGRALRDLGIPVRDDPSLMQILAATGQWLDRFALQQGKGSDFGELSRRALLSTLSTRISDNLPGLFEATPLDVRSAAFRMSRSAEFSGLARSYFTRLLSGTLSYWLDRTLSAQVGQEKRFADFGARAEFDGALAQYCSEATRIIREFTGGWYGKRIHRDGLVDSVSAAEFGAVAFKKVNEELRRKRGSHG